MCEGCPLQTGVFNDLRMECEDRINSSVETFLLMAELHDMMLGKFSGSIPAVEIIEESAQGVQKIGEMAMDTHAMLDVAADVINAVECGDRELATCSRYPVIREQYGGIGRTLLAQYADFLSEE